MQKVVRHSKNNVSKFGSFKSLGWLATIFYGGIQAQIKIKLIGWLAKPMFIFILFLANIVKNFQQN